MHIVSIHEKLESRESLEIQVVFQANVVIEHTAGLFDL